MEMLVFLEGDRALADLVDRDTIHLGNDSPPIRVMALGRGMVSGATSVAFGFELPDGRVVLAETSLRLFIAAAVAMGVRYGEADLQGIEKAQAAVLRAAQAEPFDSVGVRVAAEKYKALMREMGLS